MSRKITMLSILCVALCLLPRMNAAAEISDIYLRIGDSYSLKRDYQQTLVWYQKAIDSGDKKPETRLYMAELFAYLADDENCILYAQKALDTFGWDENIDYSEYDDCSLLMSCFYQIGRSKMMLDCYQDAKYALLQAEKYCNNTECSLLIKYYKFYALLNLGEKYDAVKILSDVCTEEDYLELYNMCRNAIAANLYSENMQTYCTVLEELHDIYNDLLE